jgi:hypothetical protein
MPSIRDWLGQRVLTSVKICWEKGAERITAAEATTAIR